MSWNFDANHGRTQMRDVAKEIHRAFAILILQLAIRGAHSAKRLNSALNAFRNARSFPAAKLQKRVFPDLFESRLARGKQFLLRNAANSKFAIGIYCEGIHAPSAGINGFACRKGGRMLDTLAREPSVFAHFVGRFRVERDNLLRREPNRERAL